MDGVVSKVNELKLEDEYTSRKGRKHVRFRNIHRAEDGARGQSQVRSARELHPKLSDLTFTGPNSDT